MSKNSSSSNEDMELLKQFCNENINEYYLLKDLLRIHKKKSLLQRRNGIKAEIETTLNNYIKRKKI